MSKGYNGYSSWNAWNVALWVNNDEAIYREARAVARCYGIGKAATILARRWEGSKTPDGATYNKTAIREALRGII